MIDVKKELHPAHPQTYVNRREIASREEERAEREIVAAALGRSTKKPKTSVYNKPTGKPKKFFGGGAKKKKKSSFKKKRRSSMSDFAFGGMDYEERRAEARDEARTSRDSSGGSGWFGL